MSVLRANVEFAKRILADRVGNDYVYGGNWNPFNLKVGTDCSGLVVDILDAAVNGTAMAWTRHGMSTESWRPIEVGQRGPFGTICVARPSDFPADAAVKIAIHHGPGGGANSHTWCEVDGVRGESNGTNGCVTGTRARDVYDTSYANDWHYLPGPITGAVTPPPPPPLSRADGYALKIIQEGQRLGITPRGIQIALSVALVETNLTMYANSNDPPSLNLPHDAVGSDHMSSGLFQQQTSWGSLADRMDATKSATIFFTVDNGAGVRGLTKIRNKQGVLYDYNNTANSPGFYAQTVQGSAFPDRYDQRFNDAVAIYTRLANNTTPGDDMAAVPQDEWARVVVQLDRVFHEVADLRESRSPLREPDEGKKDTWSGFGLNTDGSEHLEVCKLLAGYGHPPTLALLRRVAAMPVDKPGREGDCLIAQAILADVTSTPVPQVLNVTNAPAPVAPVAAPDTRELDSAYAENARLRAENAQLRADAASPPAPTYLPAVAEVPTGTLGGRVGKFIDAVGELDLSAAADVSERATLSASIKVLATKNGSDL